MNQSAIVAMDPHARELTRRLLRGVPPALWSVRALSAAAPDLRIVIVGGGDDGRRLAAAHALAFQTSIPADAAIIADPAQPFASPASVRGALAARAPGAAPALLAAAQSAPIERLRLTDDQSWELAGAVARGLPPDHPCITGVTRFRLPTRANLHAIVTDVDGCLTDGGIAYFSGPDAGRTFNTHDGYAHHLLAAAGIKVGWLSATSSAASIDRRATQLKVPAIDAGEGDKGPRFLRLCERLGVDPAGTLYLGDDLNDLPAMKLAGATACPADAAAPVRAVVDLILDHPGGRGAFREAAEILLASPDH